MLAGADRRPGALLRGGRLLEGTGEPGLGRRGEPGQSRVGGGHAVKCPRGYDSPRPSPASADQPLLIETESMRPVYWSAPPLSLAPMYRVCELVMEPVFRDVLYDEPSTVRT